MSETNDKVQDALDALLGVVKNVTSQIEAQNAATQAAASLGGMYKALLAAGFDENQAFTLVFEMTKSGLAAQ